MIKDAGYQEKFVMLRPWLRQILEVVKKDLKQEHLKIDKAFCKRHFMGKPALQITVDEMVPAYEKEIAEGNVGLGEFIASRWLLKNTDVYGFFEQQLQTLTPDFDEITLLEPEVALTLMKGSLKQFGPVRSYLFCVLNAVAFSDEYFEKLRSFAEEETQERAAFVEEEKAAANLESLQKRHQREVSAMRDRFDKKMAGLERKYLKDMDALKKQISSLQKKLAEK